MNFQGFQRRLKNHLIFSLRDIQKLFPDFSRIQLNRWQEAGLIQKVVNKYYIFDNNDLDESSLWLIANTIYKPSYVSLETALSHYGLIPEGVFVVTSVTTRKTYRFESKITNFHYRKIQADLFWGYKLEDYKNWKICLAEPEKAILDFFYLNPGLDSAAYFEELRINSEVFREIIDLEKFRIYLRAFGSKLLTKRVNIFLNLMKYD